MSVSSKKSLGFTAILIAITLIAILTGLSLNLREILHNQAATERANTQLYLWGSAARIYAADHNNQLPPIQRRTQPTWGEVQNHPQAWYNILPPIHGKAPLSHFADQGEQWAKQLQIDKRQSLAPAIAQNLHLPPRADYSTPERWATRPRFGYARNQHLADQLPSADTAPQVLFFETLTHRADRPQQKSVKNSLVGHSRGSQQNAADRYRNGTGAILTDGSLRRQDPQALPWSP